MQKVNVNNSLNAWEYIYRCVPEGSILDPLPFDSFVRRPKVMEGAGGGRGRCKTTCLSTIALTSDDLGYVEIFHLAVVLG